MRSTFKQSTTLKPIMVLLISSTDHITPLTGLGSGFTLTLSKNGGTFAACAGTKSEVGAGWYKAAPNATDVDTLGPLIAHATGTGADPSDERYEVVAFDDQDSISLGLSFLTTTLAAIPSAATVATAVWAATTRTLSAFGFTVNTNANATESAIKAKTDNLPTDPTSETNATTNTNSILTAIPSAATVAAAVWASVTRTLTSFAFTVSTNANSTETAIKAKTDNLPTDPASNTLVSSVGTTILAAIPSASTVAAAVWNVLTSAITTPNTIGVYVLSTLLGIKAKTDNLPANPTSETNATANTATIIEAVEAGGGGGSSHPIDPIGN